MVPSFEEHEVEVPGECPECEADLTEEGALRGTVNAYIPVELRAGSKGVEWEETGQSELTHDPHEAISDVLCDNCGHSFVPVAHPEDLPALPSPPPEPEKSVEPLEDDIPF